MVETCAWANASPSALSIWISVRPRRDALSRSTIKSASSPPGCRSVSTSVISACPAAQSGVLRPVLQFAQVVAEQGPLILGIGRAAAAAHVLHGLEIGGDSRDLVELRPQPGDDLIRRDAAFGQRLERDGDIRARSAAAAEAARADGARDGIDRGIRLDDVGHFLQFSLHHLERTRCVAADAALELAGVLLRKNPLGITT